MKIIWDIIETEGGYVNHPADKGGPTKYGITQRTYSEYVGREVSINEVRNLSKEMAFDIYQSRYLIKPRITMIQNEFLKYLMLDMSVHHGPVRSIRMTQQVVNSTELFSLNADGILGPISENAINTTYDYMGRYFTNIISHKRADFMRSIVDNNPSQKVFLKGWLNRANSFLTKLPHDNVFH